MSLLNILNYTSKALFDLMLVLKCLAGTFTQSTAVAATSEE